MNKSTQFYDLGKKNELYAHFWTSCINRIERSCCLVQATKWDRSKKFNSWSKKKDRSNMQWSVAISQYIQNLSRNILKKISLLHCLLSWWKYKDRYYNIIISSQKKSQKKIPQVEINRFYHKALILWLFLDKNARWKFVPLKEGLIKKFAFQGGRL